MAFINIVEWSIKQTLNLCNFAVGKEISAPKIQKTPKNGTARLNIAETRLLAKMVDNPKCSSSRLTIKKFSL